MTDRQSEVEDKYDVADDFTLPDLTPVGGVTAVSGPVEHVLTATYFDTADLRLAGARVTLRARTGGSDDGWHLKLPGPDGDRIEVHRPLGSSTRRVPAALLHEVRVLVRDAGLLPVARLRTHRTVHALLAEDGTRLAEVCDDRVTGEVIGEVTGEVTGDVTGEITGEVIGEALGDSVELTVWREVEVELVEGRRSLLRAVGKRLRAAGAEHAGSASKLARTLGDRVPATRRAEVDPDSAGGMVLRYVAEQVDALAAYDPRVREDAPDAVHKMRVATRRLRSALRSYRPLFDREVTEPIRAELRWLAGVLGAPRDAEVLHHRVRSLVGEQPVELLVGPVAARVDRELRGTHRAAHKALRTELSGSRYFRLLDALDALLADPPLTGLAAEPAAEVLPALVHKAWRRTRQAADRAAAAEPAEPGQLHDVRKAAKQARYAAEAAIGVGGVAAADFARRMRSVQSVLGEHHDAVVAAAVLREMGVRAHLDGENGFSYGRLHALEEQAAADAERGFAAEWADASARRHRRWLRT